MSSSNISRRDIFRLLAAAGAGGAMLPKEAAAQAPLPLTRNVRKTLSDPDFQNKVIPWDKPLIESELATLTVLVDLILPADDISPAASAVGVPDFLNEWVGAPYKDTIDDCEVLRGGVSWINNHSFSLHEKRFTEITADQQTAILDSICDPAKTAPELVYGAHSSTWKSLGYVGNVPIPGDYPGVPDEIIKLLKLEDVI
jgi:hypothetical protein